MRSLGIYGFRDQMVSTPIPIEYELCILGNKFLHKGEFLLQLVVILLVKGSNLFQACNRHRVATVTLSTYVVEYELIRKWIVKIFSQFPGRGIKISRVNSIRFGESINFLQYLPSICN